MLHAKRVEALQQIAGCSRVVPVVATVVDHDMVAGLLSKFARVLDQVVAGEENLEDRIAEGGVFFAHAGR